MRFFLLLFLSCFAFAIQAAAIAVVHADASVAEGERRFAKTLATHIQRWYADAGIETDLIADSALSNRDTHRLILLVDCYAPPESFVATVKTLLQRGTRFVVCYSGSPALAALFGLRPGSYVRSDTGAWSAMTFEKSMPKGTPTSILQTSTNLFTMSAATSSTRVVGWWQDRQGKRTEAAWWRTAQGSYWMTHILTGDGDEIGKQRLLLAIAAESVPEVWSIAARHLFDKTLVPLKNGSLMKRIWSLPKSSPRRKALDQLLKMVRSLQLTTQQSVQQRDGLTAYQSVTDLRDCLERLYGMTFFARPGEVIGVWDHSGRGLYPGNWERTATLLANAGVTDVYVNVAGAAFALYPSNVLPRKASDNALAEAIAACHKHGLRVHAWILCYSCTNAAKGALATFQKKGWTLQDPNGKELAWLDPTHPEVKSYLVKAVMELAKYTVDGIHLDFIRFPDLPSSLGPRTKARFEAATGSSAADITRTNGKHRAAFLKWREQQIANTVLTIRSALRTQAPGMTLSAAVFGKYPACIDSVGQDWLSWLRTGLIDQALPMNYTEDLNALNDWLGTQTADPRLAKKIISGIGVTAAESRLDPIAVLQHIEVARQKQCKGVAFFDLDETLRRRILPVISVGVTKQ